MGQTAAPSVRLLFPLCLAIAVFGPSGEALPLPSRFETGGLVRAVRAARDAVFPALVHVRPVVERTFQGRRVDAALVGSGVVIEPDGLVVTNFHVVGGARRLECVLSDGRRCRASLVGSDPATDLALLRLRLDDLGVEGVPSAELADSSTVREGDFVLAMGSPLGLTRSLSLGVVSCARRYLDPMVVAGHVPTGLFNTWIQTDAAINPGNSGGPLVDLRGRIVGINARGIRAAQNLGFAIPAPVVAEVVGSLLAEGRVRRSSFGWTLEPAEALADPDDRSAAPFVASVAQGSPSERAGVRVGDRVLAVGGRPLRVAFREDLPDARRLLARLPAGRPVAVTVEREGESFEVSVTPEEWAPPPPEESEISSLGITVRTLGARERFDRGLDGEAGGLLVTSLRPGGRLARAEPELRVGDVLLRANGRPLRGIEGLDALLAEPSAAAVLEVARGRERWWLLVPAEVVRSEGGA